MADETEPRRAESVSTTLARMEGKFDLHALRLENVALQTASNTQRLDQHDRDFESVRLTMQQIAAEAKARADAQAAAALAVKETRQTDRDADERRWTPKARLWTAVSTTAAVGLLVVTILTYLHR